MTRITLDLDADDYGALNRWLISAAVAIDPGNPRRVSLARGLRAMIRAATRDPVVNDIVLDQVRRDPGGQPRIDLSQPGVDLPGART